MSFDATVLQVLIASPSDVSDKRNEIEKQIFEWNKQYAEELNIVLLPKRWEDVAPAYSTGDPQQLLNEKLVEKSDILIGVFWTRLGTPTARYSSGTLEEISICIEKGKEIMLYFLNDNIPMDVIASEEKQKEFMRVQAYKKEYGDKGLYSYKTDKIKEHLYEKVMDYRRKSGLNAIISKATELSQHQRPQAEVSTIQQTDNDEKSIQFLIQNNRLTPAEIILLGYILETGDRELGHRWKAEQTKKRISEWEGNRNLTSYLSSEYDNAVKNLADRDILEAQEYTGPGNVRLYGLPMNVFDELRRLNTRVKKKITKQIEEYAASPF